MSHAITTQYDTHTLNTLQRIAEIENSTKEAIIESVVRQSMNAYEQLERDIQEARDDVAAGRVYTDKQVAEMLMGLGVDVSS